MKDIAQHFLDHHCALIIDPAHPILIGISAANDATPDLTFISNDHAGKEKRHITALQLVGDHHVLEITIPNQFRFNTIALKWTEGDSFRNRRPKDSNHRSLDGLSSVMHCSWPSRPSRPWTAASPSDGGQTFDTRLWKAAQAQSPIKKQVADLNRNIEHHCMVVCRLQWNEVCNRA